MDSIIENILNYEEWVNIEVDPFDNTNLLYNVAKIFGENQTLKVNNKDLLFNVIKYEYESLRIGMSKKLLRDERVQRLSGTIIIYLDGETTKYIVDRVSMASAILKKINNYEAQFMDSYNWSDDFLMWLTSKALDASGAPLEGTKAIFLDTISRFKCETDDRLAVIPAEGEISNFLRTLPLLSDIGRVSQVQTRVRRENRASKGQPEIFELSLSKSGNECVSVEFDTYCGMYMYDPEESQKAKILLVAMLEVIPQLLEAYNADGAWLKEKGNSSFDVVTSIMVKEKFLIKLKEKLEYELSNNLSPAYKDIFKNIWSIIDSLGDAQEKAHAQEDVRYIIKAIRQGNIDRASFLTGMLPLPEIIKASEEFKSLQKTLLEKLREKSKKYDEENNKDVTTHAGNLV